ncbi:DNA cytosine methyltransferase [Burkholderia plantarii]|uniref:DNA cytosine methyltransferase n=1 Tax=Burkholderia plantarii TaxID=41899 RepID=UPI0009BAFC42|nr:DNA cytosine methyltransferase [Burkholderia plantarii]
MPGLPHRRRAGDPRDPLIFSYPHIVAELRPRRFIFENVEGLLTSGHGEAPSSLVREFLAIGHGVRLQKVNLAGCGVPQTRKRVRIIGHRIGADFQFPEERFSCDSGLPAG